MMKTQLDFVRETRRLEKATADVEKGFLYFVADKLRTDKNLTTAEKYTVLTAIIEEQTRGAWIVAHGIYDNAGVDPEATKLAGVIDDLKAKYNLAGRLDVINTAMAENDETFRAWNEEHSEKSPLLPN